MQHQSLSTLPTNNVPRMPPDLRMKTWILRLFPHFSSLLMHAKAVPPCCSQSESPEGFSAFSELKAGQPGLQLSSRSHRGSTDHAGQ